MSRKIDVVTLTGEEYDSLMADKERMDWLEKQDCWIGVHGEYEATPRHTCGGGYSDKVRDVCDRSMDA